MSGKTVMLCTISVFLTAEMAQEDRDWKLADAAERLRVHMANSGLRQFGHISKKWLNPMHYAFIMPGEEHVRLFCKAVPFVALDPVDWRGIWLS